MNDQPSVTLAHRNILAMRVDATNYSDATRRIIEWAKNGKWNYVCAANVHMVMESYDSDKFRRIVNGAAIVTPDGMPLVWGLRLLGVREATRVYGPDLTAYVLEAAMRESMPVGFYGGSAEVLKILLQTFEKRFPGLKTVYSYSPPFRLLSSEEDERIVAEINASGARILFVGLGCPKQERWIEEHSGRINSVMLGVGAAFDFISGAKSQAPRWMMRAGLEWLFRLVTEPHRLWRRYCVQNPRFVILFLLQLLKEVFVTQKL
jgi:N-acetylglucosaminyldiphosphoundecaprenol N-acetyl-beta-D-mannosaminyltransferase